MLETSAERQTQRILDYFHSLSTLGREVNSSNQIGRTLTSAVTAMVDVFGLRRAALLAANDSHDQMTPVAVHDLGEASLRPVRVPRAIRQDLIVKPHLRAFRALPGRLAELLKAQIGNGLVKERSAAVPLVSSGELVGLFIFERFPQQPPLDEHDCNMLSGMCQNIGVYLYNQTVLERLTEKHREIEGLYGRVKEIYREAVMAFLTAIDIKDGYTKEHSLRVASMAAVLAQEVGFTEHEVEGIYFAGLLHDIGKILVDKQILTKRGGLDLTEYAEMSQHTRLGAQIISNMHFPWENLVYAVRHHHDRPTYDEFSPPRHHNLDLGTKIVGLIDAFDAMTSDRPYRRALSPTECFSELTEGLNDQFDPEITRAFLKVLERDLDRPPRLRQVLTDKLLCKDAERLRQVLADALQQVEQFMGVITAH